ncbi:MAG: hypothetical protein KJO79_08285, partial [Verrucomicrobiae bacterium]|nr:hypothetical protein [Verrucomicrobiae bacterium]NNJ87164.1 hypothetical protein [Akkermansiaceae bacterium]
LWEGRFKSVLVEDGYAARVMAAYIDLNPIRAGMVKNPEEYKWCSYGEAMQPKSSSGRKIARDGICRLLETNEEIGNKPTEQQVWNKGAADHYRMMLFADGEEIFAEDIHAGDLPDSQKIKRVRKGFRRKNVEKVLAKGGKLSFGEAMRCRVRYFSDGMTVGSREFVDQVFIKSRDRFGKNRKTGARPMRGVGWTAKQEKIYSMRQLVKNVLE